MVEIQNNWLNLVFLQKVSQSLMKFFFVIDINLRDKILDKSSNSG